MEWDKAEYVYVSVCIHTHIYKHIKTRDLLKKIERYQGNISCKMALIKTRNGMDLTEAEDIKKRWQEYTEL